MYKNQMVANFQKLEHKGMRILKAKSKLDIFHMTFPKIGLEISFPFSSPPVPC